MVQGKIKLSLVPILGIIGLAAMFFKLPEISCKTCFSNDPYMPLVGAGYFAVLVALSLLFPAFPKQHLARSGLMGAILLAFALTYLHFPSWCQACLVGHACNVLIWGVWVFVPRAREQPSSSHLGVRLSLSLFAPISVIALFSSLNLTFMAYDLSKSRHGEGLRVGDLIPSFTAETVLGSAVANQEMVFNFVSPDCPYCKEQLQVFHTVVSQRVNSSYRFINVSPALPPALIQYAPTAEWVEDRDQKLRKLFQIQGYPTLVVVGEGGKILKIIRGVPAKLQYDLELMLLKSI
jgi:thiol-disulfide isomerase/thioredoxin